jgi:N-acetylglutamate synthase-like GNAT family acetyltransferase
VSDRIGATVRAAAPSDVSMVEAVVDEAFHPYVARIGVRPVPMEADYSALVDAGQVWVAERGDGQVCGVIVLVPEADHLTLDTIAVTDEVRGTGVGAALMAYAEERARVLGLPEVHLYTNEMMWENLEYYPRLGYVEQYRATVGGIYHRVFFTKSVI